MRIFTGSALLATPARPSTHTPASASFKRRIFSSQFRRACALQRQASRCENGKIVGCPTDFGKPAGCGKRPPSGTLRHAPILCPDPQQPHEPTSAVGEKQTRTATAFQLATVSVKRVIRT